MDKFGYIRGKRGPPGPKGKDAIPLYSWCPDAMLQMFRQSENCTYYFNDANSGVMYNKKTGQQALRDQFGNNHALCLKNFKNQQKLASFIVSHLKTLSIR